MFRPCTALKVAVNCTTFAYILNLFEMVVKDIFDSFEKMKILVVGDVMLDVYLEGDVDRISPEAPVPIVRIQKKESRLGGAANVAINCKALGAQVAIAGSIGADEEGYKMLRILSDAGLNTELVLTFSNRKTTTKTRVLSRSQQIIRFDSEEDETLLLQDEHLAIDKLLKYLQIQKPDVLIFEDYNKGFLTENLIQQVIRHCKILKIPIVVDPKKSNFFAYKGVDIFKPNLKEIKEGLNISIDPSNIEDLKKAHSLLKEQLGHQISFITLSNSGVFYADETAFGLIPSHRRNVADVSGAGDTTISVAAMVYTLTKNVATMAAWANLAGGLVCEEAGVVPVNRNRLMNEIEKKLIKKSI